jgi:hypothetical protein
LKKRWEIREDGKRVMIKCGKKPFMQEPVNEKIASMICRKLKLKQLRAIKCGVGWGGGNST